MSKKQQPALNCQMTGKELQPGEAVFFTVSQDNILLIDFNRELPGKHICLECNSKVIKDAIIEGVLKTFFGTNIQIPENILEKITSLLHKKAIEMLCLARKSGSVTFGFEKVMASLKSAEVSFLLQASDGKDGGKQKTTLNAGAVRIFSVFTSAELGKVIGRGRVVHMAMLKGNVNMSMNLITLITRLRDF